MRKRNTIEDVARHAGVGKVTVSYVLNGRGEEARISQETQNRVLVAARELDYRPNALARALVRKRADAIAVVFQYADSFSATSAFIGELMRGVCEGCVQSDVDLILHTRSMPDAEKEANALTDGRADGVLLLRDADDPLHSIILQRDFPIVLFFARSGEPNAAFVDADNYEGGRLATQHLLDLGHRRIAMITGSAGSVSSNDRFSGYRSALEAAGLQVDPNLVMRITSAIADMTPLVQAVREGGATGVFVWSDDVALGCMRALQAEGFSIPDDVSFVGFDSSEACERSSPPLTSIRQPVAKMAATAARLLVAKTRGEHVENDKVVFPLYLDVRGSTATFKVERKPSTQRQII